jgi:hypothetical protein
MLELDTKITIFENQENWFDERYHQNDKFMVDFKIKLDQNRRLNYKS